MPTHWESSERPLFVRTVVVNGSRHAILSQVDPLCQARKSDSSPECLEPTRKFISSSRRIRSCDPFKRDITTELQKCLVKLRVVLSKQEERRRLKKEVVATKDEEPARENWKRVRKRIPRSQETGSDELVNKDIKQEDFTGFRKGNSYCKMIPGKECEDNSEDTDVSSKQEIECSVKESAKISEFTNSTRRILPLSEATEELFRNYSSYFFPIVYIKANGLLWENVAGESTVPKELNNPLSERVLQWLDLAKKRKESFDGEKLKSVEQNQLTIDKNNINTNDKILDTKYKPIRCKSEGSLNKNVTYSKEEDVEDEVKNESDIETALSSTSTHEYPKFSKESNKQHILKDNPLSNPRETAIPDEDHWEKIMSIPDKATSEFSLTEQLQQSILESFEAIVNLERKTALERTHRIHSSRKKSPRGVSRTSSGRSSRKKSLLMKQTVIRISSDEDETSECTFIKQKTHNLRRRSGYFNGKKSWKYHSKRIISANEENLQSFEETERQVRIIYNETPLSADEKNNGGRRIWATEKGANKPHLHIFMPGMNPKFLEAHDDSSSDIESIVK